MKFKIRIIPIFCLVIGTYFAYHMVQGNRGLRRSYQLDQEISVAQTLEQETAEEKILMQAKVKSLSPTSLDIDQLEESARRILNMGHPDDKVILHY